MSAEVKGTNCFLEDAITFDANRDGSEREAADRIRDKLEQAAILGERAVIHCDMCETSFSVRRDGAVFLTTIRDCNRPLNLPPKAYPGSCQTTIDLTRLNKLLLK